MDTGFGFYGGWMVRRHGLCPSPAGNCDEHRAWAVKLFALTIGPWLYRVEDGSGPRWSEGSVASRTLAAGSTRSLCSFSTFPISPLLNWSSASVEETGVCWSIAGHLCCCLLASAPSSRCDLDVHGRPVVAVDCRRRNVSADKGAFVGLNGSAAVGLTVFHAALSRRTIDLDRLQAMSASQTRS
jgi:hypothetical protein